MSQSNRARFVPQVDRLEDRTVPALVGAGGSIVGTLVVNGTSNANTIRITIDDRGTADVHDDQVLSSVQFTETTRFGNIGRVLVGVTDLWVRSGPTANRFVQNVTGLLVRGGGRGDRIENLTSLPSILLGGGGNDTLIGGSGRDVLIGGTGADTLVGDFNSVSRGLFSRPAGGEDILIGGSTVHDANEAALRGIFNEWTLGGSFDDRVNALRNGGPRNGTAVLNSSTVIADRDVDSLNGAGARDWVWADPGVFIPFMGFAAGDTRLFDIWYSDRLR